MDNILKLRKAIIDDLGSTAPRLYYNYAPSGATFPYSVFLLDTVIGTDGMINADLTIDVADLGTDDTAVETLAGAIQNALDYEVYFSNGIAFESYAVSRSRIDEKDKNIMRIRLTFDIRAYETIETNGGQE